MKIALVAAIVLLAGCSAAEQAAALPQVAPPQPQVVTQNHLKDRATQINFEQRFVPASDLCTGSPSQGYTLHVKKIVTSNGQMIGATVHNELLYSPINVWFNGNAQRDPDAQVYPGDTQTFYFPATDTIKIAQSIEQPDGGPGVALTLTTE